jgi:tetratricopeptide (TPR) repeat protein
MLETIREFAGEQLSTEEQDQRLRLLLDYLLELFEGASLYVRAPGRPHTELAQAERPNVDVALAWATEAGEVRAGLRLLELLEMYWQTNDPAGGRERLDALLAPPGADELEPRVLATALRFRGGTFDLMGRNDLGEPEYARAIELLQSVGDEKEAERLRLRIAHAALHVGDIERARRIATAAFDADPPLALAILARIAFAEEDSARAARLIREAAEAAEAAGLTWWHGVTMLGASEGMLALGELETAQEFFSEGVELLRSVHDLVNLPIALCAGAALAAQLGDPLRAGTLWGAAEAQAERDPRQTTNDNLVEYEPHLQPVRGEAFEAARADGRTRSLEEALAYALGDAP